MAVSRLAFLFFDLDGVLIDSEPHHARAEHTLYREASDGALSGPSFNTTGTSTRAVYEALCTQTGRPLDADALTRRHYALTFASLQAASERAMPGLLPLLDALGAAGIPAAVVSSSSRRYVEDVLRYLGISDRFRFAVCGDEAPRLKPAPDPYLCALRQAGVPAAAAAAIEDSRAGVLAANAAGLFSIGLDRQVGQDLSAASVRAASLFDVPRLLGLLP